MPSATRRQALRAGVLAVTGLAGCSTLAGSSNEPPRLDSFRVQNYARERRTAAVQFVLDGDVVFWRDLTIQAYGTGSGDDLGPVHSEFADPSAYPDERGQWMVRLRDRATGERASATFTADDFPGGCITLAAEIGRDHGPAIMRRSDTTCDAEST